MSGVKRTLVSVDAARWREAQAAASQLRQVRRDLPRILDNVRDQARQDTERAIRPVAARAEAAERAVSRLSDRARKFERETNTRLARQSQAITALRRDTFAALDSQERRLRQAIDTERAERRRAIAELRTEVDALTTAKGRASDAANEWISDGQVLADLIRTTLPAERFAPGRLALLERDLAMAKSNAATGFLEQAALAGAQQAYHQLSDLRFEIECADREWRALRDTAGEALLVLTGLIEQNSKPAAVGWDGTEIPDVQLDVDHWSRGRLTELRDEVATVLASVRADSPGPGQAMPAQALTAADLRRVITEQAPQFEGRLADIVEHAALAQLGCQTRVEIADRVMDTLEANGFELRDSTFAGDDDREAFFVRCGHPDGGEIVIDVAPVPEDVAACELRILSYEHTGSEEVRDARAKALADELREDGLQVGAPLMAAHDADERERDLEAIRKTAVRQADRVRTGRAGGGRPAAGR